MRSRQRSYLRFVEFDATGAWMVVGEKNPPPSAGTRVHTMRLSLHGVSRLPTADEGDDGKDTESTDTSSGHFDGPLAQSEVTHWPLVSGRSGATFSADGRLLALIMRSGPALETTNLVVVTLAACAANIHQSQQTLPSWSAPSSVSFSASAQRIAVSIAAYMRPITWPFAPMWQPPPRLAGANRSGAASLVLPRIHNMALTEDTPEYLTQREETLLFFSTQTLRREDTAFGVTDPLERVVFLPAGMLLVGTSLRLRIVERLVEVSRGRIRKRRAQRDYPAQAAEGADIDVDDALTGGF
jgi:hypothetical protein